MNKKTKWILAGVIILVAALAIMAKMGVFGGKEATKVTAEAAERRTITEIVSASGRVYPEVEVKVSPDISGEITELTVKEGDTVKKGQLLARIYADIYDIQRSQAASGVAQSQAQVDNSKAGLDALKAQMEQAEKTYHMQQQLFQDKVISQNEFNTAESAYKSAKANYNAALQGIRAGQAGVQTAIASLRRADKDLSRTSVTAPMNGVVSLLNVKKGERVVGSNLMAGTEMLRIADMSKIEVRVDVGENDIPKVKLGDSAWIEVDAYGTRKFRGLVTQIASSNTGASAQAAAALSDVTQYKVYIRLMPESYADLTKKGGLAFRPGMTATADIQTKTNSNVLSVPINAVTTRAKNEAEMAEKEMKKKSEGETEEEAVSEEDLEVVVFILGKDNKVKKAVVETGIQDLNYIEIRKGLEDGAQVVSGPYEVVSKKLKDDMEVVKTDKKDLFKKD
jgi:HlyD family secretion protein